MIPFALSTVKLSAVPFALFAVIFSLIPFALLPVKLSAVPFALFTLFSLTFSLYVNVTFLSSASIALLSSELYASPGISSTSGFSSRSESTLSPHASVWLRLFERLESATTGPNEPIIAMVHVRMPSIPIEPLSYKNIVSASMLNDASNITRLVNERCSPSNLLNDFCIFAKSSEYCDIWSFLF